MNFRFFYYSLGMLKDKFIIGRGENGREPDTNVTSLMEKRTGVYVRYKGRKHTT